MLSQQWALFYKPSHNDSVQIGVDRKSRCWEECPSSSVCHFIEDYVPTIEDSYRTCIVMDQLQCTSEIEDTAGEEQILALQEECITRGEGFVCVFSIDDWGSFEKVISYDSSKDQTNQGFP